MTDKHRSLSAEQQASVKSILRQVPIGYLAVNADGPYAVPMNFAYDGPDDADSWGRFLYHTGPGKKADALAADPRVCLAVLAEAAFTRGDLPCDDAYAYRSVLVEGRATLLADDAEREQGLRLIVAKYDPEAADRPFNEGIFEKTLVYEVTIEAVSLKQKPRT